MSLRIRRGTDSQRQQITPDEGELIFTTNTQKLYMGDGITQGGINIGQTLAGTGLVFDSITQTLQATGSGGSGSGLTSVSQDLNPALGGNLNLNSRNITGTGNISVNGSLSVTGLGANLSLNSFNITGTGNINTTGTLGVSVGLSRDLSLNSFNLIGTGNINTTGTLGVSGGLSRDLALGGYAITGTGNVNITGSGTFTSGTIASLTASTTTISTKLNVSDIEASGLSGLNVKSNGTTPLSITGVGTLGATSGQVYFNINAAKGTIALPTTTAAGDGLGGISIQGYDGTGYKPASLLIGNWDATATLTDVFPKSILKLITGGGGSTLQQASLNSNGVFTAPVFKATNYATGSFPANPEKGWIIFDSTANDFMGYNGTAWVAFTGP